MQGYDGDPGTGADDLVPYRSARHVDKALSWPRVLVGECELSEKD